MADVKRKRNLAEMDADEFMSFGFDSDVSEEEETKEAEAEMKPENSTAKSRKSKTSAHKDQLARLKEKDPEFYKYLQENDEELLQFNDSDTDSELEDEECDESEESGEDDEDDKRTSQNIEQAHESEESDQDVVADEMPNAEKIQGKLVTMAMVKKWKTGLEKHNLQSLKQVTKAFRSAVHGALETGDESKTEKTLAYRVEGNTVFNAIVQLCLKHICGLLHHHVGTAHSKHGKRVLPSSNKKWPQIKTSVKWYLSDMLQLLRTLVDPSMLCVILRHVQQLCAYYACFPKIARAFIKRLVRMWGSGEEHVRVLAFLGITKLATMVPTTLLDFSVKQLYMGFVKNCKFTSPKTKPLIAFMENSLVEMFSLDPGITYQHGFTYIRQLAIHLRNAITHNKKESHQSVYNWQFIHCLHLWCRVLSEVHSNGVLEPLIYPVVQIVLGVIKLVPTARFYPLRFHCVQSLNLLSKATDVYIPVAPFLLEIIDSSEFTRKIKMSTAKPTQFSCILKVSKSQLATKAFRDAVVDHIFDLLLEFFAIHSHSIAFPEIVLPAVVKLKKFIKSAGDPKYRKQMKQLLDKIEETSKEVTERRSSVCFNPKDLDQVKHWTAQYRQLPNGLTRFHTQWKATRLATQPQDEDESPHGSDSDSDEDEPKPKRKKTERAKKPKKQEDLNQKKMKPKAPTSAVQDEDVEDIVEDFRFSSDED